MKKEIRKWSTWLRIVAVGVMAIVTFVFVTAFSVYAAQSAGFATMGTISLPKEEVAVEEQTTALENCGFSVTELANGNLQLNTTTSYNLNTINKNTLKTRHEKLKETGIISYILYKNFVCSMENPVVNSSGEDTPYNLVIQLDLSDYSIVTFQKGFLESVIYAMTGSVEVNLWFYTAGSNFSESSETGTAPIRVIDVARGRELPDVNVEMTLRGMSDRQNYTTYFNIEGDSETYYVHSYSLHIILPRNMSAAGTETIAFQQGSLDVNGFLDVSVSPPDCIGFDISNMTLDTQYNYGESGYTDYLNIDENAASETRHFHYICTSMPQMHYSFQKSLASLFSQSATNCVEEVFVKPYANVPYARAFVGAEKAGNAYSMSIYDQPSETATPQAHDVELTLWIFWWVRFHCAFPSGLNPENLTYKHYERDEDMLVDNINVGTYTCDWALNAANPDKLHAVYCSHKQTNGQSGLVGYFDSYGKIYDENGTVLVSV